jgi:hypothetical protein
MSEFDAYVAGLIDGEGSIMIVKATDCKCQSGFRYSVEVQISNNCREVLEKINQEQTQENQSFTKSS